MATDIRWGSPSAAGHGWDRAFFLEEAIPTSDYEVEHFNGHAEAFDVQAYGLPDGFYVIQRYESWDHWSGPFEDVESALNFWNNTDGKDNEFLAYKHLGLYRVIPVAAPTYSFDMHETVLTEDDPAARILPEEADFLAAFHHFNKLTGNLVCTDSEEVLMHRLAWEIKGQPGTYGVLAYEFAASDEETLTIVTLPGATYMLASTTTENPVYVTSHASSLAARRFAGMMGFDLETGKRLTHSWGRADLPPDFPWLD